MRVFLGGIINIEQIGCQTAGESMSRMFWKRFSLF